MLMNKSFNYFFCFLICLVCFNINLWGQEKQFRILVKTEKEKGSFAKVEFRDITFLANKEGVCDIDLNYLYLSDIITVSLLGYKDYTFSINKNLLQKRKIVVEMLPQIYGLKEVIVKAKGAPVFRKVLNRSQRYKFNREPRSLKFTYKKNNQILLKGQTQYTSGLFKGFQVIDTSVFILHPELKSKTQNIIRVIWSITKMTLISRRIYKVDYQGKRDGATYWKLKVRDKKKKVLKMTLTDDFTGIVHLNSKGFIQNFDMQMITNNETSSSYLLKTRYSLRNNNIYSQITEGEFILKNKSTGKFEKIEFKFEYLN